jgi:hypothetical protein
VRCPSSASNAPTPAPPSRRSGPTPRVYRVVGSSPEPACRSLINMRALVGRRVRVARGHKSRTAPSRGTNDRARQSCARPTSTFPQHPPQVVHKGGRGLIRVHASSGTRGAMGTGLQGRSVDAHEAPHLHISRGVLSHSAVATLTLQDLNGKLHLTFVDIRFTPIPVPRTRADHGRDSCGLLVIRPTTVQTLTASCPGTLICRSGVTVLVIHSQVRAPRTLISTAC